MSKLTFQAGDGEIVHYDIPHGVSEKKVKRALLRVVDPEKPGNFTWDLSPKESATARRIMAAEIERLTREIH